MRYVCSICEKDLLEDFVISCPICGKIICLSCYEDNDGMCIDCLMELEDNNCIKEYINP